MEQIKKLLKLNKTDYYITHLSILNCILPQKMTPKEIEVLAAFMQLEGDIASYRFSSVAKKIVMNQIGLTPAGLSNYMKFLFDKGFLIKEVNGIKILPILIPEKQEQLYLLKLQIKEDERENQQPS